VIDARYLPDEFEARLYKKEQDSGLFEPAVTPTVTPSGAPHPSKNSTTFCTMMPPPNVTGSLHMGHALNMTLQDILVRYHRMLGNKTLWQPGTDHAGIATQALVERELEKKGIATSTLSRQELIDHIWQWKERYGNEIIDQLHQLGASAPWQRLRFTLDDGLSQAVNHAFCRLYDAGLIYRGKRLVNWDPKLKTALSDLEVKTKDVKGTMWHIRYPLTSTGNGADTFIVIATTRPETMAGDCAIAVHPEDARYRHLIGTTCRLPLFDRQLPIIADSYADPEKGSGAVKITPAHDFNDFEVGQRHQLPCLNIFDEQARYNDNVAPPWRGLDRFEARKRVLEALQADNLVDHEESVVIPTPFGDRSDAIIEPWLTDQWFADAAQLAPAAIQAVKKGAMTFTPQSWAKTYLQWLDNIQPWCLSRQIRWGHRIPAWHAPDGTFFVAENEQQAHQKAEKHYGKKPPPLQQDPDVLDTWFSSALWPLSTLGWPEETADLKTYYPTSILVTGFDILFFWVARMAMMGLHLTNNVPFRNVYVHALVRDAKGQKMSKSRGNVIDPLVTIRKYGADALRFTMAASAIPGRDVRLSDDKLKGYRNFATKVWNATRFCLMKQARYDESIDPDDFRHPLNQWLVSGAYQMSQAIDTALAEGRFDNAAHALYQFIWHQFCDIYIEAAKTLLNDPEHGKETQQAMGWGLATLLQRLYPFMPFISQRLWQEITHEDDLLIQRTLPPFSPPATKKNPGNPIDAIMHLAREVRTLVSDLDMPQHKACLHAIDTDAELLTAVNDYQAILYALAPLDAVSEQPPADSQQSLPCTLKDQRFALSFSHPLDKQALSHHLAKKMAVWQEDIKKLDKKLSNSAFIAHAPSDIVADKKQQRARAQANQQRLQQTLAALQKE